MLDINFEAFEMVGRVKKEGLRMDWVDFAYKCVGWFIAFATVDTAILLLLLFFVALGAGKK